MNRRLYAALAIILSVTFGSLIGRAAPPEVHLPLVANGPSTVCDGSAPLLDQDTGNLSAMRDADGRYIVAYQDRAHGSLAHIAQHVGDHLEEVTAPAPLAPVAPAFSPSGVKQGSLALVPSAAPGGKSRLYYTQRKAGDETGPYGIWCLEF